MAPISTPMLRVIINTRKYREGRAGGGAPALPHIPSLAGPWSLVLQLIEEPLEWFRDDDHLVAMIGDQYRLGAALVSA